MTRVRGSSTVVQYRVGRRGVPASRSFETWVDAALSARRGAARLVNVLLFDEHEARALNRQFRGKDYATNVLSFGYEEAQSRRGRAPRLLGDLVICAAVVAREALGQGKPARDHFAHLTIHGVLHLLGFDHETERAARRMEALERRLLAGLGIPDPYS